MPTRSFHSNGLGTRILASLVRLSVAPAILLSFLWFTGFSITFIPFDMGDASLPFQVIETSVSGPFPMPGTIPTTQAYPVNGVTANPFDSLIQEAKQHPIQTSTNRQTQSAPVRSPGSKTLINRFAQPTNEPNNNAVSP